MEEGVDTVGNGVLLLFGGQDFLFWKSWVEEGVDTVGNGVLLLFAEDKTFFIFFGNLGWRRVLTQLVTVCCCRLEDNTFLEILGGGGC